MIPFLVMIWFHFHRFTDCISPRSETGLCYLVREQGNVSHNEWVWRVCDMTHWFSVNSCPISDFWWETSDVKKSGKIQGNVNSLKSVGPGVRPMWSEAGSGAKAAPLAARPGILCVFATLYMSFLCTSFHKCLCMLISFLSLTTPLPVRVDAQQTPLLEASCYMSLLCASILLHELLVRIFPH